MSDETLATREEAVENGDDVSANPNVARSIGSVIADRFSRRDLMRGALAVAVTSEMFGADLAHASSPPFKELASGLDETHHVAQGHDVQVVLRWGDPLVPGLPPFNPAKLTAQEQGQRFGYNNDYVAFFPLVPGGERGLLCVNHEYCSSELMFPGLGRPDRDDFKRMTRAMVEVEMAAHGVSVVEVERVGGAWQVVLASPRNRRITADTPMTIDGPAAGHARLQTNADPTGRSIHGTFNNCAGGHTPWGTYLTAEENFNVYFFTDKRSADGKRLTRGAFPPSHARSMERYSVPTNWYNWGQHHDRFNIDKEPNEANRFGWIVEIDPNDPTSTPVKHSALGRFCHEGAELHVNSDGRVVVYSGDDARFEYVYRYVSNGRYVPADGKANSRLLSDGVLSVARFDADGSGVWLPLVHGQGPLTAENGFTDQADVLIDARRAADLLKATPMDRPEDVQVSPRTGTVMIMLTNNDRRKASEVNAANPRAENQFGHIVELMPTGGDHAAATFRWDILVRCGDPKIAEVGARWNPATSEHGWFNCPDNVAFDADGRMWVTTDQARAAARANRADGLYRLETEGAARGLSRLFFRAPIGAEVCGPCFTPDNETVFLSIQHPGVDGARDYKPFGRDPTYEDPPTRWPDFKPDMPPRPSLLAIRRAGGGRLG